VRTDATEEHKKVLSTTNLTVYGLTKTTDDEAQDSCYYCAECDPEA